MSSRDDDSGSTTIVRWRGETATTAPPCLVVLYGAELGHRLELRDEPVTLGRGTDCDLVAEDDDISRRHCCIHPRDGAYWLRDLGSTNGTWLNERRVSPGSDERLENGARVRLGRLVFKFLQGGDVEALYHEEIYRLTIVDGLTGIYNRRYFEEQLEREIRRWKRHKRPLALVIFDVDFFKSVNDRHGHPVGDQVLLSLSQSIRSIVRAESCLARLSGDEFAVVLPETPVESARIFAERVRGAVECLDLGSRIGPLTISLGIAQMDEGLEGAAQLLERADRQLYEAKQTGRNRAQG